MNGKLQVPIWETMKFPETNVISKRQFITIRAQRCRRIAWNINLNWHFPLTHLSNGKLDSFLSQTNLSLKSQYLCKAIRYECNESTEKHFSTTIEMLHSYYPDEGEVRRFIKSHIFINEAFSHECALGREIKMPQVLAQWASHYVCVHMTAILVESAATKCNQL